jgi:hypothetical protein
MDKMHNPGYRFEGKNLKVCMSCTLGKFQGKHIFEPDASHKGIFTIIVNPELEKCSDRKGITYCNPLLDKIED